MENNYGYGGIFRNKPKLELVLLAIGFALFIFLGARGLARISDKAVAAGEAYKASVNSVFHDSETAASSDQLSLRMAMAEQTEEHTNTSGELKNNHADNKAPGNTSEVPALTHEVAGMNSAANKNTKALAKQRSNI